MATTHRTNTIAVTTTAWTKVVANAPGVDLRSESFGTQCYIRILNVGDDVPTSAIDDDTDVLLFKESPVEIWALNVNFDAYIRCKSQNGSVKVTI